ncbi:F-box protein SKIP23-like [Corylus avellana]|uniref:F-box protein SKIP23-like n=1 Tax=Corylus avellana TaxID=13451 RepID=UPI001E1F79BB|nr:F-box protein SKIP23-like [Corylus avellana]
MDEEVVVNWSDLPDEILPYIGKSLDAGIDVLRFRSVCTSWRSSIPSSREISPCFPLPFPYADRSGNAVDAFVSQSTIYRLEPSDKNPNPSASSSSSSSPKGWLIKVEESETGQIRLLNPLSSLHTGLLPASFPKLINLLDFRAVEVSKAYKFQYSAGTPIYGVSKVVLYPNSAWTSVKDCMIFAIYDGGKLGSAKYGDQKWTLVDDENSHYDDIIVYKGQFYVIDRLGIVFWIECSSLKLIQFFPPLCGLGTQKHLVESCGEFYVVDRYFDGERRLSRHHNLRRYLVCSRTVDFKVYKLDQECGDWVMVQSLGDRVFFLGNDCSFSVSARRFGGGCKGNCIYFSDENDIGVFYLNDHMIGKIINFPYHPHIFWPPPSWLTAQTSK